MRAQSGQQGVAAQALAGCTDCVLRKQGLSLPWATRAYDMRQRFTALAYASSRYEVLCTNVQLFFGRCHTPAGNTSHRRAGQKSDHEQHSGHCHQGDGKRYDEADHRRVDHDDGATGVERDRSQSSRTSGLRAALSVSLSSAWRSGQSIRLASKW